MSTTNIHREESVCVWSEAKIIRVRPGGVPGVAGCRICNQPSGARQVKLHPNMPLHISLPRIALPKPRNYARWNTNIPEACNQKRRIPTTIGNTVLKYPYCVSGQSVSVCKPLRHRTVKCSCRIVRREYRDIV